MVRSNEEYLSNSLEYVYKSEIGQRIKYTANTGVAIMTTANANLDGTGTISRVLTSAGANGTIVKTITLKGVVSVTRGMVRLYINPTSTPWLISEIEIPAVAQDAIQKTFALSLEVDFLLENGWSLEASTQNAESMTVTAEGLDISFP